MPADRLPLARRLDGVASSPVRDLLALTERPDVICFAGGLPARGRGLATDADDLLITTGPQQALTLIATALLDPGTDALRHGVAFVPGETFFAGPPDRSTLRMSFTTNPVGVIAQGIDRLRHALGGRQDVVGEQLRDA